MRTFSSNSRGEDDFNFVFKAVKVVFIITFILTILLIGFYVWVGYSILDDPEAAGEVVGKVGKGIQKGLE